MGNSDNALKMITDLRDALAAAREHADGLASREGGARAEAAEYGDPWADEVREVHAVASSAARFLAEASAGNVDDSNRDDFAANLEAARVKALSAYDAMLVACDHAGADGGEMQDYCYELEDFYNAVCAAADAWKLIDSVNREAGASLGTIILR